jgi:sec-independent protein translocase protein TatC
MISEEENKGLSAASETANNDPGLSHDPMPEQAEAPGVAGSPADEETAAIPAPPAPVAPPPQPPSPPAAADRDREDGGSEEEDEEEEMLRMSFLEHLEELRSRILKALAGVGIAFLFSIIFANELWKIISEPAVEALTQLGYENTKLAQIKPMEAFTTVWVKLPILTAIFLASPWVLYQVWAFIAPGLYRRERRWAAPFVIFSAGLFILGGLFAYFVAFRFGLTFLLGIGRNINIAPVVSITEYFDLFVNVTLGIGLVFQLPVLIFFLTLLRITTPGFLLRNARYAVLIIVILAALVTPTPDVVNLMLFSVPMCLLYFVGIFAGYLLELRRARRRFPWKVVWMTSGGLALVAAAAVYLAVTRFGYHLEPHWPFLVR